MFSPQLRWMNTLLGNLKPGYSGTFYAFNFEKYARPYLGGFRFRFNRSFSMAGITERIASDFCCCMSCKELVPRVAEDYG